MSRPLDGASRRLLAWMAALALLQGCAGLRPSRLASAAVVTCKHCNCLMPANAVPESPCGVCRCGFRAAQCVGRGSASQCLRHARP